VDAKKEKNGLVKENASVKKEKNAPVVMIASVKKKATIKCCFFYRLLNKKILFYDIIKIVSIKINNNKNKK